MHKKWYIQGELEKRRLKTGKYTQSLRFVCFKFQTTVEKFIENLQASEIRFSVDVETGFSNKLLQRGPRQTSTW